MHKLVILVEAQKDPQEFHEEWPEFLHQAEQMPGLRRETSSHVEHFLVGGVEVMMMHELFFDTSAELRAALNSPSGQEAGKVLQRIARGKVTLFFADHKEDDLPNFRTAAAEAETKPDGAQRQAANDASE
jgi:uncharacterized protein (TIGR02118 family)